MRFTWAGGTDTGRVKSNNEDVYHPEQDGCGSRPLLLAVADGMGGLPAGEVASRIAVGCATARGVPLDERVEAANRAVMEAGRRNPGRSGMGTTLTLAKLHPDGSLSLRHVGDSRAYLLRDGGIEQLTVDHTLAQEMFEMGQLTEEQARRSPYKFYLNRGLGFAADVKVDACEVRLRAGDRLMLCSDGLNEMLPDEEIQPILENGAPAEAVQNLIEAANQAGGYDNITVVAADVEEDG